MTISIGCICQKNVDLIRIDDSVAAAAERMRQRTVGALIAVNDARQPIGLVTDRDLVIRAMADGKDPDVTPVIDVMTPDLVVAQEDTPVNEALRLMREGPFRRLPIVDKHGALVGLITLDDILRRLAHDFSEIGKVLDEETPAAAANGAH